MNNDKFILNLGQLSKHCTLCDCWVSIFGQVFDVSEFISKHPGGCKVFRDNCGNDITSAFRIIYLILENAHYWVNYQFILKYKFKGFLDQRE